MSLWIVRCFMDVIRSAKECKNATFAERKATFGFAVVILAAITAWSCLLPNVFAQGETHFGGSDSMQDAATHCVAKAERGLTGTYSFSYGPPGLRAKTQRDADAPIRVRLQRIDSRNQYEASFIGTLDGVFDLSEALEHSDGSAANQLTPMPVRIVSTLPNDERSDLFEATGFEPRIQGGYRIGLLVAGGVWLAIPLLVSLIRRLRRPVPVAELPEDPPPSLAEQIAPLVEAASSRELSTAEKARLELLLLHLWREREGLPAISMATSITQLRQHPEAGPVLSAVEAWLHSGRSRSETQVETHTSDEVQSFASDEARPLDEVLELLRACVPDATESSERVRAEASLP